LLDSLLQEMTGKVLVYGACGGLGREIVDYLKSCGYWILSVDIGENQKADATIQVSLSDGWLDQEKNLLSNVGTKLAGSKLDGIINVAGGWAGGNTQHKDWIKNADLMWKQSVWSSSIAATLAAHHLKENGVLVLPGAKPATDGTPGMMGYGMAKAAVHQLVKSLGSNGSGLPEGACALGLLPVTLDTPMNRKFNPDADRSTWTPLTEVAKTLTKWIENKERPSSGSLVSLLTENGATYHRLE